MDAEPACSKDSADRLSEATSTAERIDEAGGFKNLGLSHRSAVAQHPPAPRLTRLKI